MNNLTENGREELYGFEGYRLDPGKMALTDPVGRPVKLLPKSCDILTYLVRNRERVVSKDELLSELWPDTVVEENNLTQNISYLRKAFDEKPYENRFISTIPGRGYRFVADVTEISETAAPNGSPTATEERAPKPGPWKWLALAAAVLIVGAVLGYFSLYRDYASSTKISSLAILPFKPITQEKRDEALELGMTDALIGKLGDGELRVLPLGTVRRFSANDQDPLQAGRQLGVEAVLDGGVQISGDRVRMSVKLLRVSDGRQLWAGQFDEPLGDIFSVQDSVSARVAAVLAVKLSDRPADALTDNVEAYQLFMRGKYHAYKLVLPEVQKGIGYYEQAISVDPNFAMAYVELSNAYRAMVLTNDAPSSEIMPRARATAVKAVELDDNLAEAWTALASNEFWYAWDWTSSEAHFKRALELDPNSAATQAHYAHLLSNTGRHDEAIAAIRRSREIDPVHLLYTAIEGQILSLAGRDDQSTLLLKAAADLDPNFWLAHLFLSRNYLNKQQWPEALQAATRAREITRGNAEATGTSGYILARMGRNDEGRELLKELEQRGSEGSNFSYPIAQIYLALGDREKALDHLEKGFSQKEPLMVFLKVERRWDPLRSDPRFVNLMKRLKFD